METIAVTPSLRQQVLERLRDAILEGQLEPGSRLKVRDLAGVLGVSTMPVLEALHVLVTEGLAVRHPRRGVVVSELTPESVRHAYEMIGAVSGLAARHVAGTLAPEDLDALRRLHARMQERLAAGKPAEVVPLNREFHAVISAAYPSEWANDTLRRLWNYTYRLRRIHPQSAGRLAQTMDEHEAILRALKTADAAAAERLVREHALHAAEELVAQMEAHGHSHGRGHGHRQEQEA